MSEVSSPDPSINSNHAEQIKTIIGHYDKSILTKILNTFDELWAALTDNTSDPTSTCTTDIPVDIQQKQSALDIINNTRLSMFEKINALKNDINISSRLVDAYDVIIQLSSDALILSSVRSARSDECLRLDDLKNKIHQQQPFYNFIDKQYHEQLETLQRLKDSHDDRSQTRSYEQFNKLLTRYNDILVAVHLFLAFVRETIRINDPYWAAVIRISDLKKKYKNFKYDANDIQRRIDSMAHSARGPNMHIIVRGSIDRYTMSRQKILQNMDILKSQINIAEKDEQQYSQDIGNDIYKRLMNCVVDIIQPQLDIAHHALTLAYNNIRTYKLLRCPLCKEHGSNVLNFTTRGYVDLCGKKMNIQLNYDATFMHTEHSYVVHRYCSQTRRNYNIRMCCNIINNDHGHHWHQ